MPQAFRPHDNAVLLLTFNVLDITARSNTTGNPVPTDSVVLEHSLGGFDAADINTVYYGSGEHVRHTPELLLARN